ncbi:MAG: hypothetical protein KGH88_10095, partial [Thaumarchaeota archaeon]|nr:hypothetical protein [Nitrososphaerota archaeon]
RRESYLRLNPKRSSTCPRKARVDTSLIQNHWFAKLIDLVMFVFVGAKRSGVSIELVADLALSHDGIIVLHTRFFLLTLGSFDQCDFFF